MSSFRSFAFAGLILIASFGFAEASRAQSPTVSRGFRFGLRDAARDSALAPWQREVMAEVAARRIPGGRAMTAAADSGADGTWRQLPPASARYLHTAIYDPVHDRMVVFGGYSKYDLLNDVWALSLAGTPQWTQLMPVGTPPSGRHLLAAIYDPVRQRMILFGGQDRSIGYRDDVWALSLDSLPTWSRIVPVGPGPIARSRHSAVYDPVRDRMVVFGGYQSSGYRGATSGPLNDVWTLSLSGTPAWTRLAPAGTPPSARYDQSAVYDSVRDRIVVFGGFDGQSRLNDVWALSLNAGPSWRQLHPGGPPPTLRFEHAAIFDAANDRMVLYGGMADGNIGDTWLLSFRGGLAWSRIDAPSEPSPRSGHSAIYDPRRARMVIFGGTPGGSELFGELWAFSLAPAPAWTNLTCDGRGFALQLSDSG